jgi:hypothetical protein
MQLQASPFAPSRMPARKQSAQVLFDGARTDVGGRNLFVAAPCTSKFNTSGRGGHFKWIMVDHHCLPSAGDGFRLFSTAFANSSA